MPLLGSESNERPTGLVWRVLKFAMTSAASAAPVERLVYTAVNRIARYGNRALCILATLSVLFAKSTNQQLHHFIGNLQYPAVSLQTMAKVIFCRIEHVKISQQEFVCHKRQITGLLPV